MSPWTHTLVPLLRSTLAAALLALSACGGGVETGGTGAYYQGPVSGFGSVIVAGVQFDDSNASIDDLDGVVRRREDLRLGMLVEIESGPVSIDSSGGRTAVAKRIRLASEMLGPVASIDLGNSRLVVLGQTVRLSPATLIDGLAGGAPALRVGDVLEVNGFSTPSDGYVATRLALRPAQTSYRLRGQVRNLDTQARTLRIGAQTFDLAASGIPAGLAEGQFVRLTLQTAPVGARWPVLSATIEARGAGEFSEAEVEGLITAFTSAARFEVNGVRVDATGASFTDGSAGLREGVRVKVRGRSRADELLATTVSLRSDNMVFDEGVDVRDQITSVDAVAQTFTLRGVSFFYGSVPPPRLDNGGLLDLVAGRRVRVRGVIDNQRARVIATRIEFVTN